MSIYCPVESLQSQDDSPVRRLFPVLAGGSGAVPASGPAVCTDGESAVCSLSGQGQVGGRVEFTFSFNL